MNNSEEQLPLEFAESPLLSKTPQHFRLYANVYGTGAVDRWAVDLGTTKTAEYFAHVIISTHKAIISGWRNATIESIREKEPTVWIQLEAVLIVDVSRAGDAIVLFI